MSTDSDLWFVNNNWFDSEGSKVQGGIDTLLSWIRSSKRINEFGSEVQLAVGTDSHVGGMNVKFPSVVCLYTPSKGGLYYYTLTHEPKSLYKGNQQYRMFTEVAKSVELATYLEEQTGWKPTIHIDASPKGAGHFTSAFSDALKGYATGFGFSALLKPASFAANSISDRHSK